MSDTKFIVACVFLLVFFIYMFGSIGTFTCDTAKTDLDNLQANSTQVITDIDEQVKATSGLTQYGWQIWGGLNVIWQGIAYFITLIGISVSPCSNVGVFSLFIFLPITLALLMKLVTLIKGGG
jgi:hypothetical protein